MPFARWIKNQNNRPVCIWNDDIKISSVHSSEILPLVKSGVNEVLVAIFTAVPFGRLENIRTVNAKHASPGFFKRAA